MGMAIHQPHDHLFKRMYRQLKSRPNGAAAAGGDGT